MKKEYTYYKVKNKDVTINNKVYRFILNFDKSEKIKYTLSAMNSGIDYLIFNDATDTKGRKVDNKLAFYVANKVDASILSKFWETFDNINNDKIDDTVDSELDLSFNKIYFEQKIEEALEKNDKELFIESSDKLNKIEDRLKNIIKKGIM